MTRNLFTVLPLALVLLSGCSGSQTATPASPPALAPAASDRDPSSPISHEILERDQQADKVSVRHILIAWDDLAAGYPGAMDPRAKSRNQTEAAKLARELLSKVGAGEDMVVLMATHSEDAGSAGTGLSYTVARDSEFVFEFRRLALRLKPGETGICESQFGYHVMKRVE